MSTRTPPLAERHAERAAKRTEFGGWEMPVEFDSIRAEHRAVRESAGIFDVSHMGEVEVGGPDGAELLQRLTTNDVTELAPGESQYAAITDEDGIILDDTVVYRLPDEQPAYLFIPNAGHDGEMTVRWTDYRDEWGLEATVENRTEAYAMFAVQGPDAAELVADATAGEDAAALSRFEARYGTVAGVECWISRTGYTGEDGYELLVPWGEAETVWSAFDCQPCGLGARDTLRIEAGFLLSGQDFHPEENPRTPYEAGIGFAVDLDTEFVGRDALARQREEGLDQEFVGVELVERGVPRHGYDIATPDGEAIGEVTSGTMSPTLETPIGLGYVDVEYAAPGTDVRVEIRGQAKEARIDRPQFLQEDR